MARPAWPGAARDSFCWPVVPFRRGRRLRCARAARCRAARWPPFFGEGGIDPRAEPGFFLTPLESFGQEHLADPTAPHADALLAEVDDQAIQGPRGKG